MILFFNQCFLDMLSKAKAEVENPTPPFLPSGRPSPARFRSSFRLRFFNPLMAAQKGKRRKSRLPFPPPTHKKN